MQTLEKWEFILNGLSHWKLSCLFWASCVPSLNASIKQVIRFRDSLRSARTSHPQGLPNCLHTTERAQMTSRDKV